MAEASVNVYVTTEKVGVRVTAEVWMSGCGGMDAWMAVGVCVGVWMAAVEVGVGV